LIYVLNWAMDLDGPALVVVDPSETPEQALRRQGLPQAGNYLCVWTGVPRLSPHRRHGEENPN
jgi:hypothetical protein